MKESALFLISNGATWFGGFAIQNLSSLRVYRYKGDLQGVSKWHGSNSMLLTTMEKHFVSVADPKLFLYGSRSDGAGHYSSGFGFNFFQIVLYPDLSWIQLQSFALNIERYYFQNKNFFLIKT